MPPVVAPSDALIRRIGAAIGKHPVAWSAVTGGGYTQALRLLVRFEDNSTAFVKAATTADTATWLRIEQRVYNALGNADFLPTLLGAHDGQGEAEMPFLVLEDLSGAHWPPPWRVARVDAVLDALTRVHAARLKALDLPTLESLRGDLASWYRVATAPGDFLALGLCSRACRLSPVEGAPRVRGVQRARLEVALPWAAREIDLA